MVAGADQANYNGRFTVIAIDNIAKSFAYTMTGTAASPATGAITCERKQRMTSDLDVAGQLKVRPTWNTASSTEALTINATNTQSGNGTTLIKAQVGGTDKFIVDKDGNITAAGNLTVAGTTTTINSTDLSIADKTVIVANGASSSSSANDAGLQIGSSNLSFKYNHGSTRWDLPNAGLNIGGALLIGGNTAIGVDGSNQPVSLASTITASSLTSIGTLSGLTVSGVSQFRSLVEQVSVLGSGASGNQSYDFANQAIYYHPSLNGDITASLSNVPTTDGQAYSISIVAVQGATPYKVSSSIGINGASKTIQWSFATQPTGDASRTNIWSLSILRTGGDWVIYGSASNFN